MGKNKKRRNKNQHNYMQEQITNEEPLTLLRASYHEGAILPLISSYSTNFVETGSVLENTRQFMYFDQLPKPHLITVTQGIYYTTLDKNYNLGIAFTSRDQKFNCELAEHFSKDTGLFLHLAPDRFLPTLISDPLLYSTIAKHSGDPQTFLKSLALFSKQVTLAKRTHKN